MPGGFAVPHSVAGRDERPAPSCPRQRDVVPRHPRVGSGSPLVAYGCLPRCPRPGDARQSSHRHHAIWRSEMHTRTATVRRFGTSTMQASGRRLALIAAVAALSLAACQSGDSLTGPTWQWTADPVIDPAGQTTAHDPARFTIAFRSDGTVDVTADCNSLTGTYAVGVPLDLTIDLTSSSLASCGDGS